MRICDNGCAYVSAKELNELVESKGLVMDFEGKVRMLHGGYAYEVLVEYQKKLVLYNNGTSLQLDDDVEVGKHRANCFNPDRIVEVRDLEWFVPARKIVGDKVRDQMLNQQY